MRRFLAILAYWVYIVPAYLTLELCKLYFNWKDRRRNRQTRNPRS